MIDLDEYVAKIMDDDVSNKKDTGYETKDYRLLIGYSEPGKVEYQVVNRTFGTVEFIDHLLPRAINLLVDLQHELDKARMEYEKPTLAGNFNEQREDGIH